MEPVVGEHLRARPLMGRGHQVFSRVPSRERLAQLLPGRRTLISCLSLVATALIALTYIAVGGMRSSPFGSTMAIRVTLPESGGLLANQDVTVRGLRVGRVHSVELNADGVQAIATIDSTVRIPRDSPVRVSGLSAAGEQYLDFRPGHSDGPYLRDGDVITEQQTSTPVTLAQIIDNSRGALAQLDADKLSDVFDELRVGPEGPKKLAAILDGASLLAATLDSVLPETVSILRNSKITFSLLNDVGPGLSRTSTNIDAVLDGVTRMEGGFRTLLAQGNPQLAAADNLIADNRHSIVQILGNLTTVSQVVYMRIPALQDLWRPDRDSVIDRVAGIVRDGGIWGVGDLYPKYRCDYGQPRLPPSQADFPEPYRHTYCNNPDPSVLVRGARNAPRPPGDDTAGPPPGHDPDATTDPTPNYPPYTLPTNYGGPPLPESMPN